MLLQTWHKNITGNEEDKELWQLSLWSGCLIFWSSKLTIRAYSWFFTKVYKAYVDISHFVSHTILGGMILKRTASQHRHQPIRTDVVWSEWMLVVNVAMFAQCVLVDIMLAVPPSIISIFQQAKM